MKTGDKVVCIEGVTSHGVTLVEGEIYTVMEFLPSCCGPLISVGIYNPYHGTQCRYCGRVMYRPNVWYHDVSRFRPIDYSTGEKVCEAIEQEMKKETEPVTVLIYGNRS